MARHRCDLVMKGGITSGVVFPRAIQELSKNYDLQNIAGTSAGAIAAVLAAAAQYGRNNTGADRFDEFGKLATWLGGKSEATGRSNLLQLFQPTHDTAPLFNLATSLIRPGGTFRKVFGAVRLILLSPRAILGLVPGALTLGLILYFGRANAVGALLPAVGVFAGALVAALLGYGVAALGSSLASRIGIPIGGKLSMAVLCLLGGWVAGSKLTLFSDSVRPWVLPEVLAFALLSTLPFASGTAAFVRRARTSLPANFFGMCPGGEQPSGAGDPALTPWMHEQVQTLAGRGLDDEPLTFGDLKGLDEPVNLLTMTTCLTHGRPYLIPFDQHDLFFDPAEYRRLFPEKVVSYLEKNAMAIVEDPEGSPRSKAMFRAMSPRLPLPDGDGLPILLAARMSLSFPFLLSAVPLWSFDWNDRDNIEASEKWRSWGSKQSDEVKAKIADPSQELDGAPQERYKPETLWFSDGGLSSNFPVHLFDQMIPKWPTFAINLRYHKRSIEQDERVQMIKSYSEGKNAVWSRMAEAGASSPGGLGSFAGSLIGAMQNWVDNTLLTVPGYTDRIAHVNLGTGEGGLNLEMTPDQIEALAVRGELAAELLRTRFHAPADDAKMTWDAHRWTRFRSTLGVLQKQLAKLREAFNSTGQESEQSWIDLIERAKTDSPYKWKSADQAALAFTALNRIDQLLTEIEDGPGFDDDGVPKPRPELQLRPPL